MNLNDFIRLNIMKHTVPETMTFTPLTNPDHVAMMEARLKVMGLYKPYVLQLNRLRGNPDSHVMPPNVSPEESCNAAHKMMFVEMAYRGRLGELINYDDEILEPKEVKTVIKGDTVTVITGENEDDYDDLPEYEYDTEDDDMGEPIEEV